MKNTFMTTSNSPHPVSLISYGGFISTADKENIIYRKILIGVVSICLFSAISSISKKDSIVSKVLSYKVMSCNKTHGALLVHGVWLHWRARVRVCIRAVVCETQVRKHYIEPLPSALKDKRSFSQGERSAIQLPLDCTFALWK